MVELLQNTSNLKKIRGQGDSISAYLFILVLEIAFLYIKEIKMTLIFLRIYSYILLMPIIQHFL